MCLQFVFLLVVSGWLVIPRARQAGLRMIVAPDMVLRWHRAPTWTSALDN